MNGTPIVGTTGDHRTLKWGPRIAETDLRDGNLEWRDGVNGLPLKGDRRMRDPKVGADHCNVECSFCCR